MAMRKILLSLLLLPFIVKAQPIYPPATQAEVNAGIVRGKFVSPATLNGYSGSTGISNIVANMTTNIPVFGAVYGTAAAGTNGTPYTVIWPIHGVNTNVSTNAAGITVLKDGFYQVGATVSLKATNNDTFFIAILTNGVEHSGLRQYVDYQGATTGAALKTNQVSTMGIVYALSNTAFSVQIGWHLAAVQAMTNISRAFFVNKINSPPGGSGGGAGLTSLPAYALTNENVVGNIVTNYGPLKQNNNITVASNAFVSQTNLVSSLWVTNSTELRGSLTVTNGNIKLISDGFNLTFGDYNGVALITNNASNYMQGPSTYEQPGAAINVLSNGYVAVENGGSIGVGANPAAGTNVSKIQFGSAAYIVGYIGTDNQESNRYRFKNDSTGNTTNVIQRQWEVVNIASNAVKVTAGSGITVTPSGSGGVMSYAVAATGSGTPAGNNGELQINSAGSFGANTNLYWEFGTVDPRLVIGKALYNAGQPYVELRGVNGTNRISYFGLTTMGGTASIGASNDIYRIIIGSDIVSGTQLVPGSGGGYLRAWSGFYGGLVFTTNTMHAAGIITASGFNTTNASPGSTTAAVTLSETNLANSVRIQGAHRMSVPVTNIVGLFETNVTGTMTVDCNQNHYVNKTNRLAAALDVVIANGADGQTIRGNLIADGTDRTVKFIVPNTDGLVANSFDISAALATNVSMVVTANYALEWNCQINRLNGTNTYNFAFGYSKF